MSKFPTRDVVKGALSYHTSQRTEANQELVDEIANAYAEGKLVEPMGREELFGIIADYFGGKHDLIIKGLTDTLLGKVGKQEVDNGRD